jgi:hypothetical protein
VFVCNSTIEQERIKIDLDVRINWVKETFNWCKILYLDFKIYK